MARWRHRRVTSKRFRASREDSRTRRVNFEALESRQLLAGDAAASVVINELHVNPANETQLIEFVELYNPSTEAVDLSGWFFADGIDYTFPDGTSLAGEPMSSWVKTLRNSPRSSLRLRWDRGSENCGTKANALNCERAMAS